MPTGRHSIDRAGYADDIYEYTDEIRDGVKARLGRLMSVGQVGPTAYADDWPGFDVSYYSDENDEEMYLTCVIRVDDDGYLTAEVYDVSNLDYDDWEGVAITATVNDDGSISIGDMSADVTAIVDAIDILKRRGLWGSEEV